MKFDSPRKSNLTYTLGITPGPACADDALDNIPAYIRRKVFQPFKRYGFNAYVGRKYGHHHPSRHDAGDEPLTLSVPLHNILLRGEDVLRDPDCGGPSLDNGPL